MSRPWMPLWISDYLGDTQHLSAAEHGAYLLLIMQYWQKEVLPDDEAQLMRIARMTPDEWSNARATLLALFKPGWRHPRIDAELQIADEKFDKRAKAGSKGGKAAALARKAAKAALLAAEQQHCQSNAGGNATSNASSKTVAKSNHLHPHPPLSNSVPSERAPVAPPDPEKELFDRGKQVLGRSAGGQIVKLKNAKGGNVALARAAIEQASTKQNPAEYIAAVIRGGVGPPAFGERQTNGFVAVMEERSREQQHGQPGFGSIIDVTPNQPSGSGGPGARPQLLGRG